MAAARTRWRSAIPCSSATFPLNEKNLDLWASDKDSPYTEVKRFDWYRGYQVGGRSLMWGRCSFRLSDFDFEANARDGIATDWPIRYADIAPWYSHVERFAGIAGSKEGLPQLPDGEFQPAMPLNCAEELVADRLTKLYDGRRRLISSRTANLTQPLPGRGACQYRDACWLGCPYGAYFSTQSATLPAAMKTGRLTLQPVRDRQRSPLRPRPQARDRRARARCRHESDDRLPGARRLSLRVDAELHLAPPPFGDRRLARWARQQLG